MIFGLMTTVRADVAKLIDPRVLEQTVLENDPLRNLKYLWRDGVRGPVFSVRSKYPANNGTFLAPTDWSPARLQNSDSATWWNDPDLLTAIKRLSAAGTRIVAQNRTPVGGFAASPGDDISKSLESIVPELSARPFVNLNGFSNLYTLQHEMVHHLDHESGLADEVMDRINDLFDDPPLTQDELTYLAFYILEARAYHLQLIGLLINRRPVEYFATTDHDEYTTVSAVEGRDFRRYRFARDIHNFNRVHVKSYRSLPEEMRVRIEHLLPVYIPNYPRDFTATGELNQARCEQNLLSDLREGRTLLQER